MMAIPEGASILPDAEIAEVHQPSRTYRLDFEKGRVSGLVDDLEAVKQAVRKILLTERFNYFIYTPSYGAELHGLIGKPRAYVQSEIKRRVREALMQDDRIVDVVDFDIRFEEETAYASFTVVSIYGNFREEVRTGGV